MTIIKEIDGLPVIDATHDIELEIAPRDCRNGNPLHADTCAAARAAKRQLHAYDVRIHLSRVYVRTNKGNWQRYITSRPLYREIIVFDRGGDMMPGTYTLIAPSKSQRTGLKRSPKRGAKGSGKKRRPARHAENVRTGPAQ